MSISKRGIVLAGGSGTRLRPVTQTVSKQLLAVYDKPMIYYPLCTLMQADVREILVITTPKDYPAFKALLSDGKKWGLNIQYAVQYKPEGIAQAFLIASDFLNDAPAALILGDNLFHGYELNCTRDNLDEGATVFAYAVRNPARYGVVSFDADGRAISLEEKPANPKSNYAVTGLYFYDSSVVDRARTLKPSARGELEITDLNKQYLEEDKLFVQKIGSGAAWLDTGTFDSLHEASSYVRTLEHRQGLKIGCPEEISWQRGWISDEELEELAQPFLSSGYGEYLLQLLSIGA